MAAHGDVTEIWENVEKLFIDEVGMVCDIDDIGALFSENNTVAVTAAPSVSPTRAPNARGRVRVCYGKDDCRKNEVCDEGMCSSDSSDSDSDSEDENGCCMVSADYSASTRWTEKCATAENSKRCLQFSHMA